MDVIKKHADNFIVILNYNSWNDTIECVEALLNSHFDDFQILLVDNHSTNDSEAKIKDYLEGGIKPKVSNQYFKNKLKQRNLNKLPYCYYALSENQTKDVVNIKFDDFSTQLYNNDSYLKHPILFIQTNKNLGFAGGNNVALRAIVNNNIIEDNSKVLLLNPDIFIDKEALGHLNKINKKTFISGCFIKNYNHPKKEGFYGACKIIKPSGVIKYLKENNGDQIDYIYGGALFTNKRTLKENGILPENYFLYWEETDWCYSAKLKGIELLLQDQALVYNKVGTSIGRGYLAYYYYSRNGLMFYSKYFKRHMFSLLIFYTLRCLKKIIELDFENAKAIFQGAKDYFNGEKGYKNIPN